MYKRAGFLRIQGVRSFIALLGIPQTCQAFSLPVPALQASLHVTPPSGFPQCPVTNTLVEFVTAPLSPFL